MSRHLQQVLVSKYYKPIKKGKMTLKSLFMME